MFQFDDVIISDHIQASHVYPHVASPNKTLMCEYRYKGPGGGYEGVSVNGCRGPF